MIGYGYQDRDEGNFETPLICLNGHVITSSLEHSPESNAKRCSQCGEATISACEQCHTIIRGYHRVPGLVGWGYEAPLYCHECGQAYPWAQRKLEAAKDYADLLDELSDNEKSLLKQDIEDLTRDTPKAQVAAARFKKTMGKVGKGAADALRDIIVDIMSEAVRKTIWPNK